MEFDLHSRVEAVFCIRPSTLVVSTTAGATIDMEDFTGHSLEYVVQLGNATGGDIFVLSQESDTGAFAGEETLVPIEEILGAIPIIGGTPFTIFRVGSIGKKRFQRVLLLQSGSPAMFVAVCAIVGHQSVPDQS